MEMSKKKNKNTALAIVEKTEADFVRKEEERLLNEKKTEEAKNDDDGRVFATASLAIGILSFVVGLSIIFPIIGIRFSNKGRKSVRAQQARIGKNLCVTALVLWLFVWAAILTAIAVVALAYFAHSTIKNW